MRRRKFITLFGGAVAWPLAARAQRSAMPVIGFLHGGSATVRGQHVAAYRQGLNDAGYFEGRNVAIEYRWAEGRYDRLPALASELVDRRVAVIMASGGSSTVLAARAATSTIPIVIITAEDPVASGLIPSLSRPGGNITGVTTLGVEVGPKRLQVLHETVPTVAVIGGLINPGNPDAENQSRDLQAAAVRLGLQLVILHATTADEIDSAFATVVERRLGAVLIVNDAFFNARAQQLVALAARHAVPAIYAFPEFVAAGGLMSYGASLLAAYRETGVYTGRILKGEKPADLPVTQSTKFEFVINLKTAKLLGLEVPAKLLALADKVLE